LKNEDFNFNTKEVENPPVLAHSLCIILFTRVISIACRRMVT